MSTGPTLEWIKQQTSFMASGNTNNLVPQIKTDSAGNCYVCYYTVGTVSGGTHLGIGGDIVVFKMDKNGNLIWIKQEAIMNTVEEDIYPSIAVDVVGNSYVTYKTAGVTSGGTNTGGGDIAVFKLNTQGDLQWIQQNNSINADGFNEYPNICVDTNGFVYVSYNTQGVVSGGAFAGGNTDIVVIKLEAATGNTVQSIQKTLMNTSDDDYGATIAADALGNIYVAYYTTGTTSGNSNTGSSYDIAVFKLNSAGYIQWVHQSNVENSDQSEQKPSIVIDSSGNSYIAYYTYGVISGGTDSGGLVDIAVFKLNTNGVLQWAQQQPVMNADNGTDIWDSPFLGIDSNRNIYVTYPTYGITSGGTHSAAGSDTVLFKMNTDGVLQWIYQQPNINTTNDNFLQNISITPNGNIYIVYTADNGLISGGESEGQYSLVVFKMTQPSEAASNSFAARVNPYLALGNVLVFTKETVDALVAGTPLPAQTTVSWALSDVPAGTLLRDLRRTAVAPVSARNRLHAYRFQNVQLIAGSGSEGISGSLADMDAYQTGWICVWSADGVAPVF